MFSVFGSSFIVSNAENNYYFWDLIIKFLAELNLKDYGGGVSAYDFVVLFLAKIVARLPSFIPPKTTGTYIFVEVKWVDFSSSICIGDKILLFYFISTV